jgi:3'(2'), 5'-bisphosphate nucleotidase
VISEESEIPDYSIRKQWKSFFLVDPLDGTKEFINRNGEFTVNIALIEGNAPVLGVVHIPATGTTYYGGRGIGAFRMTGKTGSVPVSHRPFNKSRPATIAVSRSHGSDRTEDVLLARGVKTGGRIVSGSSVKFCLVAEGTADLYPRLGPTMEWDTAAGDCIYRYSCTGKPADAVLHYNKENLTNGEFILGLDNG